MGGMIRTAWSLAIALASLLAADGDPPEGGPPPARPAAAPGARGEAPEARDASESPREARSPEETLRTLIERLEAVRKGPVPISEIAARLAKEMEAARKDLEAVRAELAAARKEAELLRERMAAAEAREEKLLARLDAAGVALLLLSKKLPRAEALSLLAAARAPPAAPPDPVKIERSRKLHRERVEPLFSRTCRRCHDGTKRKGDLVLLTRESMLAGGTQGSAVIPGKPDESLLYLLVSRKKEPHMPPGKELPAEDVQAIREWIESGAAWADPSEREF
jgi:hypothetical protein